MRSLLQVVGVESPVGHMLPEILPQLTQSQVVFRQAQLHLIAAQPGGGKTLLALWYAINSKVPSLYFSADSDSRTIATRAGAILMEKEVAQVEKMMDSDASVLLEDALADGAGHVRFNFDPSPSLEDIEEEIEAWIELHGSAPQAIFVDNLMNVASTSDNEWTALRDAMSAFHYMAREYESAFIVLHHVSENEKMSKPNYPAPRLHCCATKTEQTERGFGFLENRVGLRPRDQISECRAPNPRGSMHAPYWNEYLFIFFLRVLYIVCSDSIV